MHSLHLTAEDCEGVTRLAFGGRLIAPKQTMDKPPVTRSLWLAVVALLCWQSALASSPIDAVFARLAASSRSASKASTTTASGAPAADPRQSRKQQRGGSSLSLSPEQVDDVLRMLGFHPEHQVVPLSDAIPLHSANLRRGLQTAPSPNGVAGYLQISYHTTNNCMDLDPVVMVLGYGQCVQAASGSSFGSYSTVFSLPDSGRQVVSNLTTVYKDNVCATPVSITPSDPVPLVVDASGEGIALEACVQMPPSAAMGTSLPAATAGTVPVSATSASAPGGTVSYQIMSLSSYLPHVHTQGVALVSFPTPAQCAGVQTLPISQLAPLKLVYQSCVQVVVASTTPAVTAVWARYDVQGDATAKTTAAASVSCYSDRTCSTSAACPAAITPTWADNKLYVTSSGAAPVVCPTVPDSTAQYTVACLFDPDVATASTCVPMSGPAEVPTADAPLIENYLMARMYTGDSTCSGDFVSVVMAYGQCERNYDGIPNVHSSTTSLTVNQQNSLEATITYFSNDVCGKKSQVSKPFTTSFSAPGSFSQVGKCFQPEVVAAEGEPTSFFLEGVYNKMPTLDYNGISYTGFQSKDQCAQQQADSVTFLSLQRLGGCQPIAGGGSLRPTCNSTAIIYQMFTDPACQVPQPVGGTATNPGPAYAYIPLGPVTCSFQGNQDGFSMNSDANLYTSTSCYTAPAAKAKAPTFVINAALITGCSLALALVFCSIGACCWYQNIYMPQKSKALAEQEEQQQQQQQHFSDHPLPHTRRVSTAIAGGSDGSEDLARYRSAQSQRRREDHEATQEEQVQLGQNHDSGGGGGGYGVGDGGSASHVAHAVDSDDFSYDHGHASSVPVPQEAGVGGGGARLSVKRLSTSTKSKRLSSGGGSSYGGHDDGGL